MIHLRHNRKKERPSNRERVCMKLGHRMSTYVHIYKERESEQALSPLMFINPERKTMTPRSSALRVQSTNNTFTLRSR